LPRPASNGTTRDQRDDSSTPDALAVQSGTLYLPDTSTQSGLITNSSGATVNFSGNTR